MTYFLGETQRIAFRLILSSCVCVCVCVCTPCLWTIGKRFEIDTSFFKFSRITPKVICIKFETNRITNSQMADKMLLSNLLTQRLSFFTELCVMTAHISYRSLTNPITNFKMADKMATAQHFYWLYLSHLLIYRLRFFTLQIYISFQVLLQHIAFRRIPAPRWPFLFVLASVNRFHINEPTGQKM